MTNSVTCRPARQEDLATDVVAKVDTECLEVPFSSLDTEMRAVFLANLASHLARRLSREAQVLRARG